MKKLVGTISLRNRTVEVMQVEGMMGYGFDAVNESSLPLAVELAVLHAQKGQPFIDNILRRGVRLNGR